MGDEKPTRPLAVLYEALTIARHVSTHGVAEGGEQWPNAECCLNAGRALEKHITEYPPAWREHVEVLVKLLRDVWEVRGGIAIAPFAFRAWAAQVVGSDLGDVYAHIINPQVPAAPSAPPADDSLLRRERDQAEATEEFYRQELKALRAIVDPKGEIQNLRSLTDALLAELRGEGADGLHPTGRCRCAGEGRCLWCQRTQALIERDEARLEGERWMVSYMSQVTIQTALSVERDEARLELRRIRAAEVPGSDDAAFEGTGWVVRGDDWLWTGTSADGPQAVQISHYAGYWYAHDALRAQSVGVPPQRLAFTLMRLVAPGSV